MTEYAVAKETDLADGERILVEVEERSIGVFRIDGEYYAYADFCVHQGGPCCEGKLSGTRTATFDREALETHVEWVHEGKVLTCPWHGWEFELTSGDCLSNTNYRLPDYPVRTEGGEIIVEL